VAVLQRRTSIDLLRFKINFSGQ